MTRANERGQLGGRAATGLSQRRSRIAARTLVTGFSQTSPDLYRCAIRRAVRFEVRHANNFRRMLIRSTIPFPLH
jgi:hypothetical protein